MRNKKPNDKVSARLQNSTSQNKGFVEMSDSNYSDQCASKQTVKVVLASCNACFICRFHVVDTLLTSLPTTAKTIKHA